MRIEIPNYGILEIDNIVCDYNGTIAKDGEVLLGIKEIFLELSKEFRLFVITADTFGSVKKQLEGYGAEIKILTSSDHTLEKAEFIDSLGAQSCAALGNGNNDRDMLERAAISIAVLGDEGCSIESMLRADIAVRSSLDGLSLFIEPKRLIATLRR